MPSQLEQELARDLAPVSAPRDLWNRIEIGSPTPRLRPRRAAWPWAAAGSLAAAALALVFALSSPDLAQLAAAGLAAKEQPDFQSSNPQAISKWLREHAGVDVTLPARTKVELEGAWTMKSHGSTVGGVIYRVGGHDAVLLVSRDAGSKAPVRHGESTWADRGQVYALAFAGPSNSRLACQLCHVD